MHKRLTTLIAGMALLVAIPAVADWDPGDPAKWVQLPDLSPTGIDVNATEPYILADDFLCQQTGPITDIHIWGSWLDDYYPWGEMPDDVVFTLSIHEDIPDPDPGDPTTYSMPGQVLWYRTFQPGEFVTRLYQGNIVEGWMDPPDNYIFPADWTCWQYNFFIDASDAFIQQGTENEPIVYWLDVQARPADPSALFGWKTSLDHWNDDAVWGQGLEPYPGPWFELRYPPMHELAGESIDLAFVITTDEVHSDYLFEFSLDIGSDIELSDPQMNGNEAADPGDVYWWQSAPIIPPGRDGFKDDMLIFGQDPWPDPPDALLATRVPVGTGSPDEYYEYFDLDGHDQTDFSLIEIQYPLNQIPSNCVYTPENLLVSFDDDMRDGWPANDVPVTRPSPAGVSSYGSTPGQDEVIGVDVLIPAGGLPPFPIQWIYPFADEITIHQSMNPNPDAGDPDDDDVDSLDIVPSEDGCPYWFFTADHEAFYGLDPGDIYEVTAAGPVMVVDDVFHLGILDSTDVDAFEFTWAERPDSPGGLQLAVLFSVDEDDFLTPQDESGGLIPQMVYISWMTGYSMQFTDPLQDDIDGLTIWHESLQPAEACCAPDGSCYDVTPVTCMNVYAGSPMGPGSTCATQPPFITQDPVDIHICAPDIGTLSVTVCGAPVINYQWYKDGTLMLGETNPTLIVNQPGTYHVDAGNAFGVATSGSAIVTADFKGDANTDGSINSLDIDPFVQALTNLPGWQAAHPGHDWNCEVDCNCDGSVNSLDIDPFVAILTGKGACCMGGGVCQLEPSQAACIAAGGVKWLGAGSNCYCHISQCP